ncbi:MAG: flagellar filament capping protein FliD [Lentisphaeraceae bacterium]|nr:flagellar filament capping protein FliD [Lentisphaeraceae bacterium]
MIRFGGLATGQDTETMVNALLEVERQPMIRLEQEIVEEEEKYSAWSELDSKVSDLHSKAEKLNSFLTWRQFDVSSTDEDVVSGSANNEAATASYSVNVTSLATKHMVGSASQGSTTADLTLDGDFNINGELISVSSGDTLEDVRDAINTAAESMSPKVTASIINTTLVIENQSFGNTPMAITDGTNSLAETLGFLEVGGGGGFDNELVAASELNATVNGVDVTSQSNTGITSVLTGVTLNFKSEGSSTLEIKRDTETIKTAFQEFVDAYNAAMELAEEQTEVSLSGSGDRIDDLGVLQGDSSVTNIRFRSRTLITSNFSDSELNGDFNTLQSIGIWTDGRDNRLSIFSANKLADALENNFEEVEDLIRDFDNGVMRGFRNYTDELQTPVDGTIARRQTSIRNLIADKDERIRAIELQLLDREADLYQRFANMESSVSSIQSQGNFVSSRVG